MVGIGNGAAKDFPSPKIVPVCLLLFSITDAGHATTLTYKKEIRKYGGSVCAMGGNGNVNKNRTNQHQRRRTERKKKVKQGVQFMFFLWKTKHRT